MKKSNNSRLAAGSSCHIDIPDPHLYYEFYHYALKTFKNNIERIGPHEVVTAMAHGIKMGLVKEIYDAMEQSNYSSKVFAKKYEEYEDEFNYIGPDGVYSGRRKRKAKNGK
jgi:hypothetical protein